MRALLCAALAAVVWPSIAGAQSLAESEALARLSSDSPRVRAVRAGIDVARVDVLAAARWPNPRLIVDRESVHGVSEVMTMVAQPLPITGLRRLHIDAATAMVGATSSRAEEELRRARADLRLAFGQLVAAQSREQELTRALERLRALTEILAKREAAGDAAGFDRLRADREAFDLDADRNVAGAERTRAQAAVAAFFAQPIDPSRIIAVSPTASKPALPSVAALIERAESSRGEALALRKEIDAARLSERAAGRQRIPEPEIVAGMKSSTAGGGDLGSVVTVQATLPLFDRGRPERALARARAAQAEARLDAFRAKLAADISALHAVIVTRRDAAERYRSATVATADQIERIAQVSYDAGERGILELLDAYRTGASSRLRQTLLDAAVREAEIELEFLSGWEMPS